jgi:hypothetical protein
MQSEQHEPVIVSIKSPQDSDIFTRTSVSDTMHVRLLSVRSQEAQSQDLVNQDYAQVCIRQDGSSLCFCVCDGVGSSYKGDFAAQYLATNMVRWLQNLTSLYVHASTFAEELNVQLNIWASEAQVKLRQFSLSPETPEIVREVLEELRDTYGSETVFLCGRIDMKSCSTLSEVAHPVQTVFCWMGNVTARIFLAEDCSVTLGDSDDKVARWSTLRGVRGPLTTRSIAFSTIDRLLVYTDGLATVAQSLCNLDDEAWQEHIQRLLLLPNNDDMTALEFSWSNTHASAEMAITHNGV